MIIQPLVWRLTYDFFNCIGDTEIGPPGPIVTPPPKPEQPFNCVDNSIDIGEECFVHFPDKPNEVSKPGRGNSLKYKICCSTTCGKYNYFPNLFDFY